jgi:microcystin-dependent protein
MKKYLIFLIIIIIIIVIYCLFCNQIDTKDTFTTVSPSVIGIDDTNSIATLGDLARDYMTTRTESKNTLILGNINFKNRHVLVSDNDNWLRLKSKTDLSQNSNLAVKDFNVDGSFNLLPSGMIFAWSGTVVPLGWVICDGSNGTPDLRGKFILGQGQGLNLTNRVLGDFGGRSTIKLSIKEMPNHSHTFNQPGNTIERNDWNDVMDINNDPKGARPSFKGSTPNSGSTSVGGHSSFNNLPPFNYLVYIMKL